MLWDDADKPELQFYYLAVNHTPEGRVGLLGHYDCWAQTLDIERCFSVDGVHWERGERDRPFFPRDAFAGEMGVYSAASMLPDGDGWRLSYTVYNCTHNIGVVNPEYTDGHKYCAGRRIAAWIGTALAAPK